MTTPSDATGAARTPAVLADNPYATPARGGVAEPTPIDLPVDLPIAEPSKRLMAALIDVVYLILVAAVYGMAAAMAAGGLAQTDPTHQEPFIDVAPVLAFYLIIALWIAWNWGWRSDAFGGSIGKYHLRIMVVRADGSPVDARIWWRVGPDVVWLVLFALAMYVGQALRTGHQADLFDPVIMVVSAGGTLLMLVKLVWFLGDCFSFFTDAQRRSWHDRLAGTVVVKDPRRRMRIADLFRKAR
jgi:uncharacterized RDD family membrane protein YckC